MIQATNVAFNSSNPDSRTLNFPNFRLTYIYFLDKETMVVNDDQMLEGVKLAFERLKTVTELSAGAAIIAATSKKFKDKFPDVKRVGVILCGGNVSSDCLSKMV